MSKYLDLPDLSTIEANLDTWMYESQRLYEQAIKEYIRFREAEIEAEIEYNKQFAAGICKHRSSGEKVTIVKEIVKAECHESYEAMMKAESRKSHYAKYIEAFENRINMLKYLMKRKYGEMSKT